MSFLMTLAHRPVTAGLIDVGSTDTAAAGLNNQQRSGSVMTASGDGTGDRCREKRHNGNWVEQSAEVRQCRGSVQFRDD